MKILVTGVKGQLGYDIVKELQSRDIDCMGVDIDEMDITDPGSVEKVIKQYSPDAVIHCAAWTAVDDAEDHVEACRKVNVDGTGNIAAVCSGLDIPMMYFSTDYVFNGEGTKNWDPDNDPVQPLNVYGQSKYDGEQLIRKHIPEKHFILRLEWVYGINGHNFVKTMLKLSRDHNHLTVVNDQTGSPTYTPDIARLAVDMIQTDCYGTYHVASSGLCTWYEFTKQIFKETGRDDIEVTPVTSDAYPSKARRPHNSRLDTSKISRKGFEQLPRWQDALHRYLISLGEISEMTKDRNS